MIQLSSLMNKIVDFERGALEQEEAIELFQELVNNGMAWTLQGVYGRTAQQLLDTGAISHPDVA